MEMILIGAGMGCEALLTAQAREAMEQADVVLATPRLAQRLAAVRRDIESIPLSQLAERACKREGKVAILLSGDTGFFSAAKSLYQKLSGYGTIRVLPGMSSMQVFCAKLGASYDDAVVLSMHGREDGFLGAVSYHRKVFALTGGPFRAHALCAALEQAGLLHVRVHVGENLGAAEERIISGSPDMLSRLTFGDLSVMLIENDHPADAFHPLRDNDFIRGDVPMTKQEVRWLACDWLAVRPTDIVYDIGAGTGSVSMELARRANRGQVFAVECKSEALELIRRNRVQTGNYHVTAVEAYAPEGLDGLPIPNCVFIGGSRGNMAQIVQILLEKNPQVRMVISAIALETVHAAMQALTQHGIQPEISCVQASRARVVGGYHMMTAQNPVYLIGGNL